LIRNLILSKIPKSFLIGLFALFIGVQSAFAAIVQIGTAQTAYVTNSARLTVNIPAGVAIGDVLIINVIYGGNGGTAIPLIENYPGGWTIVSSALSGDNTYRGTIFYKVVTNTWEDKYTIALSYSPLVSYGEASIVAFRGVDPTKPIDAMGNFTTTSGVGGSTINPTGITTVSSNALVVMLGMSYRSDNNAQHTFSSWLANSPATFTELYDYGGGNRVSVGAATAIKATPGPTGNGTITLSGNNSYRGGIMLAFKPDLANPMISVVPSSLDFAYVASGGTSGEQTFVISGTNLNPTTGDITVTSPTGFEVSKIPGSGFASSVQVAYSGSALGNTSIYVRFKPTGSPANYSGDISNTGGGATSKNVAVTGNSILTYCTPVSRTSSGYITNVTLNTINNSTGQNTYTDYSGSISTNVTKNSIYDLSVTFQAGGSRRYVYAWIDWNQDGDFVDAGEEFSVGNTNLSTTLTQNITVPVNALVGNTRMRVIIRYNQAPGPCDNDNFYGEIEDYSIIVTAPCIAVGNSAVFGNNLWNVYAYDGSNIDLSGITYKGYYTESDFSFSSTNKWGQDFSPSDATGYNGCTVPNDNHTFVYKRKGFEQGVYQITVGHDDAYRLYIDGDLKSSAANWDNNTPVVLGTNYTLGATTEIEFRIAEVGGGSRGSLNFVVQCTPPEPPVLSALSTSICNGGSTTLGIASGDLKDADHWQWYSGSCGGTIVGQGSSIIVSPTATTTYYVRGEGTCEGTTCGAITITVNAPTTIANQPSDQLVCESGTATFTVAAFNAISYKWQENSGSGFVDITENSIYTGVSLATLTITNPTFSRNGYSYRCKVNGICPEVSTSNSAKLNVTATPTVAVAGDDQSICGTSVTLSANTPTAGTGSWSIQSGTGGSFGNASSPTSTFTGTTGAIYTLRWTISNTPCTASTSDVVIEFLSVPATAGTIIGNSPICAGNSGVNYAVPDIAEATSYIWAYSGTGATLNGTGNSITIDFASDVTAGNLTVKGVNDCGAGAVSANYPITVSPSPVTTVGATICAGAAGSVMTVTSNCPDLTNRNTGAKNAGTGANVAIGSNVNWSNPGNITAVGTPYATANNLGAGANSDYLVATGYNFNIPANATITGIGVSINRYGPQNFTIGCRDNSLYLVKNNVIQTSGTNKASGTQWPNSFQSASYTSDLWNLTWNVSDINNSNFGVALSVHSNRYLTVMAPQVDYMQITVSYTVPGSITWYTQSSGGTVVETGTILNPIGDPEVIAQGGIFGNLGNTNTPDTYTFFAECSSTPGCRAATDFVINACCTNPTNGGTIAVAQTICYGGDPVAFTSTGLPTGHTGTLEYKWQLSTTSNGSGFSDIPSATGLTYDVPNNLTQTTWYRRLARVSCTGWTAVASNVLEITVRNNLTAGTVGTAQTICYNTAPAGLTQTAAAAGGTGTFTYQWQNSADNVTFANITGATLATYNPGTLTTTTYYRRNVTSGTCGTVSSASVKITVNANLTAAISGGTTPVCYNTAPGTFTATGAGATGTYTYLWYKGGVSTGATTQTYTPVSLTTTTAFYCAVTSGTCGTVNTATTTITVNADLTAGTVGTAQMICYNAIPAGLTQTAAAIGGTGAFTYQWQNSADNVTFANITGATLATYTPGTLTATTYYRRKVTSGTCGTVSSASVKITVNANLTAAISGGTSTICYNTAPGTFTATGTGGTGAYTYLWYKGGVSTGITTQTYDPGNLTATTNFYCAITSGTCGTLNTATTTITVNADLTAGTIGAAQTICYNTAPAGLTQTAAATGGTGTFTYQWQSSPDNSVWTDIATATGSTYAPIELTSSTYYRRNVTSGTCGTVSSASVKITVNANLTAAISGGTSTICYNTAPGTFTATGTGGTGAYTYLWYKGGVSTGITTQTYAPGNITATTDFYCAITSGSCGTMNTALTTITVNTVLSVTATTTNNTCIGGKTGSITTSAIGGLAPYQYKLNSGTYTGTNTFSNQAIGSYTVWVKDDLGCEISTSVTVDEIAAPTDDQSSANLNSWKGHVYDATNFGRYAGYITQSEDFSTNFGANGDAYCISLLSNGSSWGSILNQTFSVRFRMNSDKTGCYLVNLQSDDGIRLTVDGKIVLSDWTNHSPKWANHVLVPLNGSSQLTLEYYENTGENQVAYTNIRKIQNELTVNTSQPICEGGTFSAISGTLDLGSGVPLPTGITATYKWSYLKSPSAVWIDIAAETGASYTPTSSIFNSVGTFQIKRTAIIASTNNLGASSAVTGITESNEATIIISATPYAIIAYPGSPYCFNAGAVSVVQTGTLGGSYSADPSGLTISSATGEVDVNTSIPGDYTITYTVAAAGGCGNFTTTATMSINGDRIWTGTESTDWNTQGNWLCGAVPDLTTNVHIPNVTNKPIINLGNTGSAKDITIAAASSVTVTGTLQIAGAIINNGTFTASSGTIEMIGSMDQDIGINGDGVFAGNTIKNLIVNKNAASVTLKAPLNVTEIVKVVKVNGDLISNGFLTLISTAEKTALIDGSGSGDVKGNVTMQRYLPKAFGYKYFSSPFKEATVAQFKDLVDLRPFVTPLPVFPIPAVPIFPNFYKYDENHLSAALSDMSGWTVYTDLAGVLHPREGYAANFGSVVRSETVYMTGEVNNGTFLTPLTLYNHNRLYTKGFNLVGNPYPSPIDWEKVNLTDSNIDNALYFFNAGNTDQYTGVYTSYINDISTAIIAGEVQEDANTFNNIIAAMQGFFVHVADPAGTNSTTATLSITNAARITDLYPIFKSALIDSRTILRFSANFETKNAIADAAVVYFDDQANRSFDKDKDALKMLNTDLLVPNLYTISTDPKQLSINGMPFPADSITRIPLGITTLSDGWINFSAKEISQLPSDLHLYLIDAVGGITQDLKQNPEYRFYLKTGEYNQRFTLFSHYPPSPTLLRLQKKCLQLHVPQIC